MSVLTRVDRHGDVERLQVTTTLPGAGKPLYWVAAYRTGRVLVDTGHARARNALAHYLDANPVEVALATHEHEDHVGNAGLLASRRIPLFAPDATVDRLHRIAEGRTRRLPLYRAVTWGNHDGSREAQPVSTLADAAGHDGARVAHDTVKADGRAFRLVRTPGHSEEHVCLLDEDSGALFAGDAVLGKLKVLREVEDAPAWLASLRRLRDLDARVIYPAHGPVVEAPRRTLDGIVAYMERMQRRAHALADKGLTERAITRELLGREGALTYVSAFEFSKRKLVRSLLSRAPE